MTPEEFRQAYFEQYSEEGDVCDDEWFAQYFDNSSDWLEVEFRSPKEGFVVYSDPESSIGGYWATTADGEIEGPFPSMSELAVALGYSPEKPIPGRLTIAQALRYTGPGEVCVAKDRAGPCLLIFEHDGATWRLTDFGGDLGDIRRELGR